VLLLPLPCVAAAAVAVAVAVAVVLFGCCCGAYLIAGILKIEPFARGRRAERTPGKRGSGAKIEYSACAEAIKVKCISNAKSRLLDLAESLPWLH